jgi:hypothetical protein
MPAHRDAFTYGNARAHTHTHTHTHTQTNNTITIISVNTTRCTTGAQNGGRGAVLAVHVCTQNPPPPPPPTHIHTHTHTHTHIHTHTHTHTPALHQWEEADLELESHGVRAEREALQSNTLASKLTGKKAGVGGVVPKTPSQPLAPQIANIFKGGNRGFYNASPLTPDKQTPLELKRAVSRPSIQVDENQPQASFSAYNFGNRPPVRDKLVDIQETGGVDGRRRMYARALSNDSNKQPGKLELAHVTHKAQLKEVERLKLELARRGTPPTSAHHISFPNCVCGSCTRNP